MDSRFRINQPINPVRRTDDKKINKQQNKQKKQKTSFKQILDKKLNKKDDVKFSKHARQRITSRNIQMGPKELDKLINGVEKAEEKGAKDSLIMVDKVAYVVSVENKTVITAIDDKNVKENVFTNIDSAVFM